MYFAYVLRNPKKTLYKGSTDNLNDRLKQHNEGLLPGYTRYKGPWECVYTEVFKTRREAEARERFFKTGKGREFLKKVIK